MKKIILSALLGASVLYLASCSKQYNENIVGNGSTSGTSGGSSTNWNWTGTAPVSFKYDTTSVVCAASKTTVNATSLAIVISSATADNSTSIVISMPAQGVAGHEYSYPMNGSAVFQNLTPLYELTSTTGSVKIITNNSSTIEGYFYANMQDQLGVSAGVVNITQGYFKVAKP